MQTREISKPNWAEFFDQVSAALQGKTIEIEIDSVDFGAQHEARKLSLNSLTYDSRDDTLFVVTEVLEHAIHEPKRIFIADGEAGMQSLQVQAADGSKQIVLFSEPLSLPPPGHD
jgi:hypothetical protein